MQEYTINIGNKTFTKKIPGMTTTDQLVRDLLMCEGWTSGESDLLEFAERYTDLRPISDVWLTVA